MTHPLPPAENPGPGVPHYASFTLRCWQDSEAHLRARLVDVNSGISYPVTHLNELPDMLWQLLDRMSFRVSDDEVRSWMNEKPVTSDDNPME